MILSIADGSKIEQSKFSILLFVARIAKSCYTERMIETYILQNLVAFADCGTLTAASEKVNITQPSLTRSLQKLEDILEVPLFNRTKNTIALNQTGLIAVDYARRILALQNEMESEVVRFYKRTREITVLSIAPAPLWHLTQIFNKAAPETKVKGSLCGENEALFSALEHDKTQIIITTENRADERFYARDFFDEHLKVFLPKSHSLAKKKSVALSDLAGETFIMASSLGFWTNVVKREISGAKFIEQNDITDLCDIINHSTLPAFVTDYTEKAAYLPELEKSSRVAVPIRDEAVNVRFYAVCRVEMMKQLDAVLRE